ncbi:hypothetical protein ABTZ21_34800 [Streptomyces sp. NPDC096191]|uniref:hypothetical protein n=1 Tax=Streptomyces sp. NPDC096191 TaxID=3155426 RepID=UPI0033249933
MTVGHTRAPVLEALDTDRREGRLSFTPPGRKQARGADPAVREVSTDSAPRASGPRTGCASTGAWSRT